MSYPYYDLVQKAFNDLKAEGLIAPRTNQEAIEQDKGLLTRRAAWYVNQQRDATHGLLEKTSGNQSQGFSVDWMLRSTDGEGWDVATDDGQQALPSNGGPYGPDAARIPSWRPPTADLAQMPDGTQPGPEPVPPPDSTAAALQALTDAVNALAVLVSEQGAQILHMRTATWHGDAAIGMRMSFGVVCPPMGE